LAGSGDPLGSAGYEESRFSLLRVARNDGPTILWVRVGNIDNRTLIVQIQRALLSFIAAVERGETVIEFIGR
jgi:predicted nuclease of predicted toxin-antitoxin system